MAISGGFSAVFIFFRENSSPDRFVKISFGSGFLADELPACQVYSKTRVLPSSSWISSGFHVGLAPSMKLRRTGWSKPSGSGLEGYRGRLNQTRSGSSSGMPSPQVAANHDIKIRRRILLAAWPERSGGNPLFDRLPGWFDRLQGLIRPPRRRAHPSGFGYASVQNA